MWSKSDKEIFVGKYKCNYCGTIYTSQNQSTIKIDFTKIYKFIGVIAALFVLMLLIITQDDADKKTGKKTKTTYKTNISYETDNSKPKALDYPESEYIKIVLSKIFGKPYEEVTKEEIDSITYLNIETEWGMYGRFKGLMYCPILYISDVLEYEGGFPKLTAIETSGYKRDMDTLKEICNISTLKSLTIKDSNLSDISGISKLENLEKLDISGNYVTDVSELKKLKKLKIVDFSDNAISGASSQ